MTGRERAFRFVLRLYPAAFRARYGDELIGLCMDELRDATSPGARRGPARTLLANLIDVGWSGLVERVSNSGDPAPTPVMRVLGLLGIAGGLILVSAFVFFIPGTFNVARLVLFNAGAIAIAIAVSRTSFELLGGPGIAAAAFVVFANVLYAAMIVVTQQGRPRLFGEHDALIWMLVGMALWAADGLFGLVALRLTGLGRIGAASLVVGSLAVLGLNNLGFVQPGVDSLASRLALAGVFSNGLGWVLLGLVVAFRGQVEEGSRSEVREPA
jgi:hypothetical protein